MIHGREIPGRPDLARMRRERHDRLQANMSALGLDGLVLAGSGPVTYATGALGPGVDSGHAALTRPVAVVVAGADAPHLWTPYPEGAPPELPAANVHPALYLDTREGAGVLVSALAELFGPGPGSGPGPRPGSGPGVRLACDEMTHPMRSQLGNWELASASAVLGASRLCKTPDELACIRAAQRINESAMHDVQALLRPGIRQTDLSEVFLRRVFELGAYANAIDPIWQVIPTERALAPWTTHGDLAFPTPSTDRFLRAGDVIWVDSGIQYEGYASDFGRTWIVGCDRPSPRQAQQFGQWIEVVSAVLNECKPGVSALELARAAIAANGGVRPWLEHFYLAHGVGTESAEMPLIGTDLGEAFDRSLVLQPGMVLVLEPVIWDEGCAGYRSEDIVAITDDGWELLSDHPYDPFVGSLRSLR